MPVLPRQTRWPYGQGQAIAVDLGLVPVEPPEVLFHGTVARFLPAIPTPRA